MLNWIVVSLVALKALLYPNEPPPASYTDLASAIDSAAHQAPLRGNNGVAEMAAELAVLAATEGHFRAEAIGPDAFGAGLGMWQIHETTLPYLGATREDAFDVKRSAVLAARLIRKSHEVCHQHPREEALAWYASGGPTCSVPEGHAASRIRMRLARWLLTQPIRWIDITE